MRLNLLCINFDNWAGDLKDNIRAIANVIDSNLPSKVDYHVYNLDILSENEDDMYSYMELGLSVSKDPSHVVIIYPLHKLSIQRDGIAKIVEVLRQEASPIFFNTVQEFYKSIENFESILYNRL